MSDSSWKDCSILEEYIMEIAVYPEIREKAKNQLKVFNRVSMIGTLGIIELYSGAIQHLSNYTGLYTIC